MTTIIWLLVTNQERLATYTRIPPGDYVFEVAVRVARKFRITLAWFIQNFYTLGE
ncbi:hypothetical protein [Alishewanella longhuensis]